MRWPKINRIEKIVRHVCVHRDDEQCLRKQNPPHPWPPTLPLAQSLYQLQFLRRKLHTL